MIFIYLLYIIFFYILIYHILFYDMILYYIITIINSIIYHFQRCVSIYVSLGYYCILLLYIIIAYPLLLLTI